MALRLNAERPQLQHRVIASLGALKRRRRLLHGDHAQRLHAVFEEGNELALRILALAHDIGAADHVAGGAAALGDSGIHLGHCRLHRNGALHLPKHRHPHVLHLLLLPVDGVPQPIDDRLHPCCRHAVAATNSNAIKKRVFIKNISKILLLLVMSATALVTAAAVIAMAAVLPAAPTKDDAIETEANSWPLFTLASSTAHGRYSRAPKADALRFAV